MTPERYSEIRALYEAVAELPTTERAAHLRTLSSDPALIGDVLALFGAGEAAPGGWITRPLSGALTAFSQPLPSTGEIFGVWRIKADIGQGGMGQVYLVERCDGLFEQRAALKLLKGLPSADRLAYFSRERQLLAKLTHPNIARLYDGGSTPEGQPFLVMEYVDGAPINSWYGAHPGLDGLLKVLIEVCEAVAFAHAQLIVHCDLKPSNILVDTHGRAILLDFGIARLLEGNNAAGAAASQSQRAHAYTPGFASPEQARGDAIGTAADVYSLGRLLAVLAGEQALAEHKEIAAVVRLATATEPKDRYPSALALAWDLQRLRANEPLHAMPRSRRYVLAKFVRRYRLAVTATAFATLAICTSLAFALYGLQQARSARDRAEASALIAQREAVRSGTMATFLSDMLSGITPEEARGQDTRILKRIFTRAQARVEAQLKQDPDLLLQADGLIGANLRLIGDAKASVESLRKTLARVDATPLKVSVNAIKSRRALALALFDVAEDEDAVATAERALFDTRAGFAGDPVLMAGALSDLAWVRQFLNPAQASAEMRQALELAAAHLPPNDPQRSEIELSLASLLVHFAASEASPMFDDLIPRLVAIYGLDHPKVLRARSESAIALMHQRKFADAEIVLRELLVLQERAYDADHPALLVVGNNLGAALRQQGKTSEAAPYYERAYQESLRIYGAQHPNTLAAINNLALLRIDQGRAAEVIGALPGNLQAVLLAFPGNARMSAESRKTLARGLAAVGRHAEALAEYQRAWQDMVQGAGAESADAREIVAEVVALAKRERRPEWLAAWVDRPGYQPI